MDSTHSAELLRRLASHKAIVRIVVGVHVFLYRISRGRIGGRLAGLPVLLLTTRGRKSGRRRTVALCYLVVSLDGGEASAYAVVGSYGGNPEHPQWYKNLRYSPVAEVEVGRERYYVTSQLAKPELSSELWRDFCHSYPGYKVYRAATSREIPIVLLCRQSCLKVSKT